MERGRILRMHEEKKARQRYRRGTVRLAFVFLTGFLGVVYLVLFVVPLSGGKVELSPTVVTIDEIEAEGFPREHHLEVRDGLVVLSEAGVLISSRGEGLRRFSAPVVSRAQWHEWQQSEARQEPVDASRLRLVVSFTGEQVGALWPEVRQLAEAGGVIDLPPVGMTLTGDTEPGRFLLHKPMQSGSRKEHLDWSRVRHMRFEEHFHSLWRSLKHLSLAVVFLALSVLGMWFHLRDRGPIPDGGVDPLIFLADDVIEGGDLDLD